MACCSARVFVLTICIVQLICTLQRQVFDFLGYMWAPILGNFFQIVFVIFGFFGIYQYRPRYIVSYLIWTLTWIGWNVFMICFYLEVGILSRDSSILNIGTGSRSWWEVNGFGCNPVYNLSLSDDYLDFTKPASVEGCLLDYFYIECIQAGLQCILAFVGFVGGSYMIFLYTKEDDSYIRRPNSNGLPYSIEYRTEPPNDQNIGAYQRPMTPRKVKRRSTRAKRGYRQSYYQNPVTRLIEKSMDTSSNDSYNHTGFLKGQSNPLYSSSRSSLNAHLKSNTSLHPQGRPNPIYVNDSETVI